MSITIAVVGAGAMGSAVARRLVENAARVVTDVAGRSPATSARATAAGMVPVDLADLAEADLVLSIVPPAEAVAVARRLAPAIGGSRTKPPFLDLNAVNPATMAEIAGILAAAGASVLDGAIIGAPPAPGTPGPAIYVAGDADGASDVLGRLGLRLRRLDGPIGGASSLKMVYAGIAKGLTALASAMLLAAERSGAAEGLRAEMGESLPDVLARVSRSIPDMYPKAYRWVAEMHEIADFLGPDDPAAGFFRAAADLYAGIAADRAAGGTAILAKLDAALGR